MYRFAETLYLLALKDEASRVIHWVVKISWPRADLADDYGDLCTRVQGRYADIVRNSMTGSWRCVWADRISSHPLDTRAQAIDWFDRALPYLLAEQELPADLQAPSKEKVPQQ